MTPLRVAMALIPLLASALPAHAFSIFHSPADDGSSGGTAPIAPSGFVVLNLWFDPEASSEADRVFGYSGVFLEGEVGLDLVAFGGEADVLANEAFPRRLGVDGGDVADGDIAPRRIGTLTVAGLTPGAELNLIAGTFNTDNGATLNPIEVPILIAVVVPEPSTALLLGAGLALLALYRRATV